MKAKSRRRLLISSIAMLLVAMLALGTATFAWFTTSTSATASKINVQTIKASELEVATEKYNDWGTTVEYNNTNNILLPASSANGTNWFTATADAKTSFAASSYQAIATDKQKYLFENELNIRNAGGAAVNDVTITFTIGEQAATTGKYYVRVAVVPITAHGAAVTEANFKEAIYDLDGVAYNAVSGVTTAATSITPKTTYRVNVGNMAGKTAEGTMTEKNYKVLVWFEGQDVDCFDANAGNSLPDITFAVSGTTASQV